MKSKELILIDFDRWNQILLYTKMQYLWSIKTLKAKNYPKIKKNLYFYIL